MRFSVGGHFTVWKGRAGEEEQILSFHNHITDYGLDTMVTKSIKDLMVKVHVGSGNDAPADSDTALVTEVASTTSTSTAEYVQSSANGYVGYRRKFNFTTGQAEGSLKELGVSDGTSLFNRQLFLDQDGNATTVTVASDETLSILCEIRFYSPATGGTRTDQGTTTIGGQSFNHNYGVTTYSTGYYSTNQGCLCFPKYSFSNLASTSRWRLDHNLTNYSNAPTNTNLTGINPSAATLQAYTPGSFEATIQLEWYAGVYTDEQADLLQCAAQTVYTSFEIGLSPGYNMYSETVWQDSHVYTAGDKFISALGDKFIYEVTTGGTSHTSAPVWPTTVGGTVTDGGGVEYECVAPLLVVENTEALTLNIKFAWGRAT